MSSEQPWRGRIDRTYRTSQPWLEPALTPPAGAPNVLMIVLDDVGFGHLGCYGSSIETPHIDALAAGGRRYNNFHTTSMCSPTRASLLTGRNHHAVGMGMIADWCTGYPGYQGQVTKRAGTVAEMLKPIGYSTFAIGKWHLTRARDMTAAGPFDQWPLGRGFERYYGFLYSLIDQWEPELFCDNHAIPTPRRPGYHLSEDLVDQTIGMIRDQQAAVPGRPFFAYLAFGACHSPHQAPRPYIDKYRGRFDEGWDTTRERWFARQVEMGIVPPGTRLSPMNERVRPWASMSAAERALCARQQEVFAGFLDHTDAQIGRLTAYLADRGLLENTLIVLLSDNGASSEGRDFGDLNLRVRGQFVHEPLDLLLSEVDRLGSKYHWNMYPAGWGHAGNTPLKWFKTCTHGGGIRDPLIVHWPARIKQGGAISSQFCHCADITPTVLEAIGLEAPTSLNGVAQLPIDGTSLLYTFGQPQAPEGKRAQYFELMGNRGIWADGWKAVTHHKKGEDFEQDRWELYHVATDFSETEDLAQEYPDKLAELVALWWKEAERNHVLPLDDRDRERTLYTYWNAPRSRWVYEPGMTRVTGYAAPAVGNCSYRISAEVEITAQTEGVILAVGSRAGGFVLYIQNGRLVHEYIGPLRRWTLESPGPLSPGRRTIVFAFRKTADRAGHAALLCDGQELAAEEINEMWPLSPVGGGVFCGYDDASPLSERYACPFTFTGKMRNVIVEAGVDKADDRGFANLVSINED